MSLPRFFFILGACCAAFATQQGGIEILSTGRRSVEARFLPKSRVQNYYVSVHIKYLADVGADYWEDLNVGDVKSDGYLYIDTKNKLKPGQTYNIWVANGDNFETVYEADFFTKCSKYTYQCMSVWGRETCVGPSRLCDGDVDCKNGEDEKRDEQGECMISLPVRPTPPPPPPDAPCLVQRREAIAAGRSNYPSCEQDGSYSPMQCRMERGLYNCYCIDKVTGAELPGGRVDYNPWSDWDFYDICNGGGESQEVGPPGIEGGFVLPPPVFGSR